ncbi:hypothetical protein Cni_G23688 [Canna indica]|uniref:Uncharacterized protein n=1 Tax=Canna indica TaxID=4628 RepID=A0AAQ3KTK8_9LILI|nr:hypothetical protein Cni_G23688 [Canna indica]
MGTPRGADLIPGDRIEEHDLVMYDMISYGQQSTDEETPNAGDEFTTPTSDWADELRSLKTPEMQPSKIFGRGEWADTDSRRSPSRWKDRARRHGAMAPRRNDCLDVGADDRATSTTGDGDWGAIDEKEMGRV